MSRTKKEKSGLGEGSAEFARAIRDIGVAAINKGQAPVVLLLLFLIVVAWRMPKEDLGAVSRSFLSLLQQWWFVGWALAVILSVAWWLHAAYMRKIHGEEVQRIGVEKSDLQKQLLAEESDHKLKSIREE